MAAQINPAPAEALSQHRIAHNATIYFLGQIITWLVNIVTISVIPRSLGDIAMGQFAFALSTIMTLQLCLMMGGELFLTKEIGRDRNEAARLLGALLGLRLALSPVLILFAVVTFSLLHVEPIIWQLGSILIFSGITALLADPLRAVLLGWEEAKQVSLLDLAFVAIPLLTIPFLRYGIVTQAVGLVVSNSIVLMLRYRWIHRHIPVRPIFDLVLWREIIRGGMPFLVNTLMLQLSAFTALALLRHQADIGAVGVYSQARRLFGTFLFVPTAIGMALLPALSRLAQVGEEEFRRLQSRVLVVLMVLALPVTTTIVILAAPISHLLYGTRAFVDMPIVLQVYALAILPMYIVTAMYQFLVAQNRGSAWTGFLIASIGFYSLFAWFLVPYTEAHFHSGAMGAVIATFLSEFLSVIFSFALLKNNPLNAETVGRIIRALVATAGMAGIMWLTRGIVLIVPMALGFVTFCILGWVLHVLSPDEQQKFVALLQKILRRRRA